MLEELYRKLIEEKLYTPSTMYEKYSDDKYFVEQLAPYILKSTETNSYYFELSSVIDKICENAKFQYIVTVTKSLLKFLKKKN